MIETPLKQQKDMKPAASKQNTLKRWLLFALEPAGNLNALDMFWNHRDCTIALCFIV